ncbi:MAG: GDSL-type esterase/lipase family protein [Longimicrobiales bacterium]
MKRVLARGMVIAASLAVGGALAEVLVRVVAPQVTMFPRYVASSEYEIELASNARIRHARGSRWAFVYTTNRLGRRGPWISPEDAAGRPTVVALGDSFTFGVGVADDEVYTARLQERLPDWVVVNGGLGGWGIDSQVKWYEHQGRSWSPQAVVLQFTANDPGDSDTGVASVDGGILRFHPYPHEKPLWQRWISGSALLQRSHLFSLLRALGSGGGGAVTPPTQEERAAALRARTESEERYVAFLQAFAETLRGSDTRLLFVSVTHHEGDAYEYDLATFPLIETAVAELEEAGLLQFVELPLDPMAGAAGSPEGHQWGPEHHAWVAEALAAALREG